MTHSDMNMVTPNETTVDMVSSHDSKAWTLVLKVTEYMHENALFNFTEAFRQLGVSKTSFYAAIRVPFVQNQLIKRYREQNVAELELINTSWFPIVRYQMELARGEHGARDAAAAARFVKDRLETLEDRVEQPEEAEGQTEASLILAEFMDRAEKTVRATRTVVTETLEVSE